MPKFIMFIELTSRRREREISSEADGVHERAAARAGEGVPLQKVPQPLGEVAGETGVTFINLYIFVTFYL